jgi:hypothetical protein
METKYQYRVSVMDKDGELHPYPFKEVNIYDLDEAISRLESASMNLSYKFVIQLREVTYNDWSLYDPNSSTAPDRPEKI